MLTLTAGSAAAVPAQSAGGVSTVVASSGAAARPVLSNELGTLRWHVEGSFGKSGVVTGAFKPRRFVQQDGKLWALGKLTATLTRGSGKVVGTDSEVVTIRVSSAEQTPVGRVAAPGASCEVLNLVLGPLDLNLLGLKVHLDKVVLNIDAEPGAGNLLCAVAGLLDNSEVLTQIRRILNSILGILKL